jgi:hypothetical protein
MMPLSKDEVRLRVIGEKDFNPDNIYVQGVGAKGPALMQLEVLNTEDGLWYSVGVVSEKKPIIEVN